MTETKAETKTKAKAAPTEAEPMQIAVEVEGNGTVVTLDGDEYVLDAQETLALKKAVDQAVVGLSF